MPAIGDFKPHGVLKQKVKEGGALKRKTIQPQNAEEILQHVLNVVKNELSKPVAAQGQTIPLDKETSLTMDIKDKQADLTIKTGNSQKLRTFQKIIPQLESAFKGGNFSGKKIQIKAELQKKKTNPSLGGGKGRKISVKDTPQKNLAGATVNKASNKKTSSVPTPNAQSLRKKSKGQKAEGQTQKTQVPKPQTTEGSVAKGQNAMRETPKQTVKADKPAALKSEKRGIISGPQRASVQTQKTTPAAVKAALASNKVPEQHNTATKAQAPKGQAPIASASLPQTQIQKGGASLACTPMAQSGQEAQEIVQPANPKSSQVKNEPAGKRGKKDRDGFKPKGKSASAKGAEKIVQRFMKKAEWRQEPPSAHKVQPKKMHQETPKSLSAEQTEQSKNSTSPKPSSGAKQASVQTEPIKPLKVSTGTEKAPLHNEMLFQAVTTEKHPLQVKGRQLTARLEQILQQFEQLKPDSKERTVFKLSSSPVGELEIHLKQQKSGRQISLLVESDSMKAEVQKMLPQIQQSLAAKGLSFSALSVDVGSFGHAAEQSAHGNMRRHNMKSSKGKEGRYEPDSSPVRVRQYGYNTIEIVA